MCARGIFKYYSYLLRKCQVPFHAKYFKRKGDIDDNAQVSRYRVPDEYAMPENETVSFLINYKH